MRKRIEAALQDYFSTNINHENDKPHRYGVKVLEGACDAKHDVEFRFVSQHSYCCFELGCHCSLYSKRGWETLRRLLAKRGVSRDSCSTLTFHVIVEAGARSLSNERMFGSPPSSGYKYEETFTGQA